MSQHNRATMNDASHRCQRTRLPRICFSMLIARGQRRAVQIVHHAQADVLPLLCMLRAQPHRLISKHATQTRTANLLSGTRGMTFRKQQQRRK